MAQTLRARKRTPARAEEEVLTLGDRMKYSLIGGVFGAVMGGALLFVALLGFRMTASVRDVLAFSCAYFAVVGFTAGAFVGDLVAASLGGLLDLLALANWYQRIDDQSGRTGWIVVLMIVWLAASWLMYLR